MSSTLTVAPVASKSLPQISDPKALTQILSRLEPKILSTDPHNALRYSAFERTKTLANLEYARTLLLRSEHSAASIKVQARKHALQETLLRQRGLIKKLSDRLFELGQLDDGNWGYGGRDENGSEDDTDENEDEQVDDVLRAVLEESEDEAQKTNQNRLSKSANGVDSPRSPRSPRTPRTLQSANSNQSTTQGSLAERRAQLLGSKSTDQYSGLRARGTGSSNKPNTHTSTSTSISIDKAGLSPSANKTIPALETAENVHADLTSSLVSLAEALKRSAQAFSDDLAADAEAVTRTEDALGKNKTGLDVATQRMGVLRRMSEGRWWWGRMMLYAGIAGLWVVLVLLVFVGPKIRF